jgi:molybdopterin molybdotransferase
MNHTLSVEDAQSRLLENIHIQTNTERLPIAQAMGRILADAVLSTMMLPPTDIAMMDGYALHHDDTIPSNTLPVVDRIAAGDIATTVLAKGTACRIFTGAMMPVGADTVVKQEDTQRIDNHIILGQAVQAFRHVRHQGEEIQHGQQVLAAGTRLNAASIGLCASLGLSHVTVIKQLRIALLVTGSELIAPGNPLPLGKIYNANQPMFSALLLAHGFDVVSFGIVEDRFETIIDCLQQGQAYDAIITTGGVSVGEEDHIRKAIEQLGHINIWQVDMKPGRPFAFGHIGETPVFGLPGKPAAAFTTFHLFVLPALLKQQGAQSILPQTTFVNADFHAKGGQKREYLSVQLNPINGHSIAHLCSDCIQSSLLTTAHATGFVMLEANQTITPNSVVPYLPLHLMY